MNDRAARRRGWAEVRWRQFRNAPRPVVRAVLSSLVVAVLWPTRPDLYDSGIGQLQLFLRGLLADRSNSHNALEVQAIQARDRRLSRV